MAATRDHERAFELTRDALSASLSEPERQWLDQHLATCADCAAEAASLNDSVGSLKSISVMAGAPLVAATQRRVRTAAENAERRNRRLRPVLAVSAFASLWMAVLTPFLWSGFAAAGRWLHTPDMLWQTAFLTAWFTPAMAGAGAALWLRPHLTSSRAETLAA
jgi:anti-sigma factor RsiW